MAQDQSTSVLTYQVQGLGELRKTTKQLLLLAQAHKQLYRSMGLLGSGKGTTKITEGITSWTKAGDKATVSLTRVGDKVTHIRRHIDQTTRSQQRLNKETRSYLRSMGFLSRLVIASLLSRSIGVLIRSFKEGTQAAREFEIKISELRTISQNSQLAFNQWSDSVKRLSDEFNRQPLDVLEGMYQTLSNQIGEGTQAVQFMGEALRLSLITTSTTTEAVQALSAAINAYGGTSADARIYADKFFKTVELGRLRLGEIANTIGRVLVLGKQLGLTFDDVTGSLAALTIQGVRASEAQTWFRNVVLKLIRPTEAMKDLFAEWGVTSGQGAIAAFGWVGVMEKLETAVGKNNEELQELGELFNRIRATTGAAGLVGNVKNLKKAITEIGEATESANEAFKIMTESVGFKLERELQKVKNYFLFLGRDINKAMYDFGETFGGLAKVIENVTNTIIHFGKVLIVTLGTVAVVKIAMLGDTFLLLAENIGFAAASTKALAGSVSILGISISGLTLAIAGAAAAGALMGYAIAESINKANTTILELALKYRANIIGASMDVASEENRILAIRTEAHVKMATAMRRVYLSSIADMQAALNLLRKNEENRLFMEDISFNLQMQTATDRKKEELIYQKMLETTKNLKRAMVEEDKDLMKIYSKDLNTLYSQAQSLESSSKKTAATEYNGALRLYKMQNGRMVQLNNEQNIRNRIQKLMLQTTKEVVKIQKDHEARVGKLNLFELKQADAALEQLREKDRLMVKAKDRMTALKDTTTNYNDKLHAAAGEMLTLLTTMGEKEIFYPYPDEKNVNSISDFTDAYKNLKIQMDELANNKDFIATQGWSDEMILRIEQMKTLYDTFKENVSAPGMEDALQQMTDYLNVISGITVEQERIRNTLDVAEKLHLYSAAVTGNFEEAIKELGITADSTAAEVIFAAETIGVTMGHVVEQLRVVIEMTKHEIGLLNQATVDAASAVEKAKTGSWVGGYMKRFASGGSIGKDSVVARFDPGEFIMNAAKSRQFLPQLVAMNSGAARFESGGQTVNNNIGDINVNMTSAGNTELDARAIATALRRELKRGTVRFN